MTLKVAFQRGINIFRYVQNNHPLSALLELVFYPVADYCRTVVEVVARPDHDLQKPNKSGILKGKNSGF